MLRFKKQQSLFILIKENSNDAKKFYKLVSQLTGQKEDNALPGEEDNCTKFKKVQFPDVTTSQQYVRLA